MTEIEKLKKMAIDLYNVDDGEMSECFDAEDYAEAIARHGTAEAAWAWHLRIVGAQKETQACYDIDPQEGW